MSVKASPAKEKIEQFGIDALCAKIVDGITLTNAATQIGVSIGTLISWLESDAERSARAREARMRSARIWDEKATEAIESAADPFELSKAKELAHHYRWRAAKISPRDYGEKLDVDNKFSGNVGLTVEIVKFGDK